MKKLFFSFILILCALLSVTAYAEGDIFSYSFETVIEESSWPGCFFDKTLSFKEGYCAFVTNPFGEVKNDTVTHVIDYSGKIRLEAGKIYTLSGFVMNPLTDYSQTIRASANLENSANTIIVNVSGADSEWEPFTTTFYAGETGDFNLSIHFSGGNIDFGFFIDELKLTESVCILSGIGVRGPSEILIPSVSETTVRFTPYIITSDSKEISILSSENVVSSCTASEGVSYNVNNFTLSVSKGAKPLTELTLDFSLKNYANLSLFSHKVTLTDNIIKDSLFNEDDILWSSSSDISLCYDESNSYISLPTNDYGDYGYFSTITYKNPQLLLEGELYVVRAKVKSDITVSERTIYAKNSSTLVGNTVYFEIKDISGNDWKDVFCAFIPEASGIYDISINLCSTYDATIFIDDITLSAEASKPEYITLHAPGNIAIPDVTTHYPVSAIPRDQTGNAIEGEKLKLSLLSTDDSITFDSENGILTVFPDTAQGVYTLSAYLEENPKISASLPIHISFDYIGDGAFEETIPHEWWTVSSPYETNLYIRNDGYSKRALINTEGDYFILLNNSYIHTLENMPYAFNGEFSCASDCTVTVFIEALTSEIFPLIQFHVPAGTTLGEKLSPELFLSEENTVGRLLLYVQSDNGEPFSIYMDNLSLKKASVLAGNLHIAGKTHINGAAEAKFSFYNSVAQNSDISSCIVNWYISSFENGSYTMLEEFGTNIYFDTTFLNKYLYFEVIPVCPITGFSGDTVRSPVYFISSEEAFDKGNSNDSSPYRIPALMEYGTCGAFEDSRTHWAEKYIDTLAYNGIVHGKNNGLFSPDDFITRAEFAKMICNAFSFEESENISHFKDISPKDWFYRDVCTLYRHGIINGISENTFSPNTQITREDAVVILMRMYGKFKEYSEKKNLPFNDQDIISSYAYIPVLSAYSIDIINGNTDGAFLPKSSITRAEAAAILYRMIKKL